MKVAFICNPSYSGCSDQDDRSSRPILGKSLQEDPISTNKRWTWWQESVTPATWRNVKRNIQVQANPGINMTPYAKTNKQTVKA
jgi:hypothetical protein